MSRSGWARASRSRASRAPGTRRRPGCGARPRSFRELDRLRLTWQPSGWSHDTTLQLTVTSAGEGRARLGVHQERLADAGERERQRAHWQDVVAGIVAALER
ncbi:hypothetical protein [Amycolatopsis magusensis]|uniref:hypothetical protein n=1 Tax=Amycolatopsis magusensis TaxID=882444 RepID=UPI003F6839CC